MTRSTAEFLLKSKLAQGFLQWLESGVGLPEEFFFATLRRVSQVLWKHNGTVQQSNENGAQNNFLDVFHII